MTTMKGVRCASRCLLCGKELIVTFSFGTAAIFQLSLPSNMNRPHLRMRSLFLYFTFAILPCFIGTAIANPSACFIPAKTSNASHAHAPAHFTEVSSIANIKKKKKQSNIRTSPNCLFPMYDNGLGRWDPGNFCQVERLTGGACVSDFDDDGVDDMYFPRMDGYDILYRNTGDGSFVDVSKEKGIKKITRKIRSNGCLFIDVDNDGDNDIYLSTVGDKRFYLLINNGFGKFTEEAVPRGLANIKKNKVKTAGFTIAAADINHDGLLDILTTEWLPWLNMEGSHPEEPLDSVNTTNVKLYLNTGKGRFEDATDRILLKMRAPRETYLTTQCDELVASTLSRMLSLLAVPHSRDFSENRLRQLFHRSVFWLAESAYTYGRMLSSGDDIMDAGKYRYYTIPTPIQNGRNYITIIGTLFDGSAIHVVASQGKNSQPTIASHANHSKAYIFQPAELQLSLNGHQEITLGIFCYRSPRVCEFDLMYMLHQADEDIGGKASSACESLGNVMEKGWDLDPRKIGANQQQMPHTEPWLKSETFVNKAVLQMQALGYGTHLIRATLRSLFRQSRSLDANVESNLEPMREYEEDNSLSDRDRAESLKLKLQHQVETIYKQYNPKKLIYKDIIDKLVDKYANGNELELLQKMKKKYFKEDGNRDFEKLFEWHIDEPMSMSVQSTDENEKYGNAENFASSAIEKDKTSMHFYDFPSVGAFLFGATFSDLDGDSWPDLVLSGDFGTSSMQWNQGDGTFLEGHFNFLEDVLDNSMGSTVGDYDLDGRLDVLFTSISITEKELERLNSVSTNAGMVLNFRGNHLYRNLGNRKFDDKTDIAGVRESGWGWGSFFFDFDNDGDLDILNGNGLDDPETTDDDWAAKQKVRLYVNQGEENKFRMKDEARSRGIADEGENRGIMTFDYDMDGDLDVLVINHAESPKLYRNDGGNYYDFVRVKALEGCGRPSIGAKVEVRVSSDSQVIIKEIGNSAAYLSQSESVAHIGLGTVDLQTVYEIAVTWPPRWQNEMVSVARFRNVPVRQTLVTQRGGFGVYNVTIDSSTLAENKCVFGRPM